MVRLLPPDIPANAAVMPFSFKVTCLAFVGVPSKITSTIFSATTSLPFLCLVIIS